MNIGTTRRITLPFPPSVNALFCNVAGRGRVKTAAYTKWQSDALLEIMAQRVKPIDGEVSISVGLVAPDRRARDGDNLPKAIFDTLVKAGILKDDSNRFIRKHSVEWLASGAPCTVLIQPFEGAAS